MTKHVPTKMLFIVRYVRCFILVLSVTVPNAVTLRKTLTVHRSPSAMANPEPNRNSDTSATKPLA